MCESKTWQWTKNNTGQQQLLAGVQWLLAWFTLFQTAEDVTWRQHSRVRRMQTRWFAAFLSFRPSSYFHCLLIIKTGTMSRILPERCTLVIRNMRSSDFEKIKSFCSKRTSRVVDMAMTYDRRDPPFSGERTRHHWYSQMLNVVLHWYRSPGDWIEHHLLEQEHAGCSWTIRLKRTRFEPKD